MIQHVHLYKPVISSEQHNHISVIIPSPLEELIYHKAYFFSKFTVIECHLQTQEHHFSPQPRKPPYLVNAPRISFICFIWHVHYSIIQIRILPFSISLLNAPLRFICSTHYKSTRVNVGNNWVHSSFLLYP